MSGFDFVGANNGEKYFLLLQARMMASLETLSVF